MLATAGGASGCHNGAAAAPFGRPDTAPARRIVALAPSITETLFAIGAGPEVVGVSQYCDYPPRAARLPRVGTFLTPNLEAIAALRPTLVIGLGGSSDLREARALRALGYGVLMVNEDSLTEIRASIRMIGQRVGRESAARALLIQMKRHFAVVEDRLRGVPVRRVLMVVGHQPMVAVGRGTYLDELITLAHGSNIADAAAQSWPRLSLEYIIAARPQVILDGQMGTDGRAKAGFWGRYPEIPAVRDGRIYGYPQDPTLHPGPRVAESLALIAARIHPEVFRRYAPRTAPNPDRPAAAARAEAGD